MYFLYIHFTHRVTNVVFTVSIDLNTVSASIASSVESTVTSPSFSTSLVTIYRQVASTIPGADPTITTPNVSIAVFTGTGPSNSARTLPTCLGGCVAAMIVMWVSSSTGLFSCCF